MYCNNGRWSIYECLKRSTLRDVFTGPIVIRTEEAFIVICVMILWVAAIALFFNRWGKIRMLEPYQPKFHEEEHRPSCPMVELASASGMGHSITGGVSVKHVVLTVAYDKTCQYTLGTWFSLGYYLVRKTSHETFSAWKCHEKFYSYTCKYLRLRKRRILSYITKLFCHTHTHNGLCFPY